MPQLLHFEAEGGRFADVISVSDQQRKADLLALLRRGLNTWTDPPRWLIELYDELLKAS